MEKEPQGDLPVLSGLAVPTEVIETAGGRFLGMDLRATDEQTLEALKGAVEGMAGQKLLDGKDLPVKATSMLGIDYSNPKASTWFQGKRWDFN